MRHLTTAMVLCLVSAGPAWSGSLYLAWDCDIPACAHASFLLNRAQTTLPAGTTTLEQVPLPISAASTCQKVAPEYRAGQTYCADIGCPTDGLYTLYLEATAPNVPKDTFAHTNTITFGVQACQLVDYEDLYATLQPDTETPAPIPDETDVAPIPSEGEASPLPDVPTAAPAPQPPPSQPSAPPSTVRPLATVPPKTPPVTPTPAPVTPQPSPLRSNLVTAPTTQWPWRSGSFAGTQAQAGLDTTMPRTGHAVQKLTGTGAYYATTTSAPFPVEAGHTYDVSALVKLETITEFVEIDVFYWDTHGTQLTPWGEAIGQRLNGTHDWTPLAGQVTVPPGANRAVIQVRARSEGGAAWVDEVTMQDRDTPGVVVAAPAREPAPTPARPSLPPQPVAPGPLQTSLPAQTRQGLVEQFTRLEREYQTAQQAIRSTYDATVQRLAKDKTATAHQRRAQAHADGTKALNDLYQTLLGHWQALATQWEAHP